jgi:hypothetical protein
VVVTIIPDRHLPLVLRADAPPLHKMVRGAKEMQQKAVYTAGNTKISQ